MRLMRRLMRTIKVKHLTAIWVQYSDVERQMTLRSLTVSLVPRLGKRKTAPNAPVRLVTGCYTPRNTSSEGLLGWWSTHLAE